MSLPKKGSRKINVDNNSYLWKAKSNGKKINLTIVPIENGKKILANFNSENDVFNNPFIITPYVTRMVILFAIENGYLLNESSKEMNLGDLTKKLKLDLSGARKTNKLVRDIERRISLKGIDTITKKEVQYVLNQTNHFIQYGEWLIGFEALVSNLHEINFKMEKEELILVKEIFSKKHI